jgi:glycine cleavage system T protein (aminomethyltransferase)
MLPGTPFHPRTAALCAGHNWRRWSGYVVAGSYELTHEREYAAVRSAAALFDVSPLFKYLVSGPDAARLLNRVMTRDVSRCRVGQVLYTPWCDGAGKVIDDGTVSRLDEQTFRVTSADPNLRWFHENALGMNVTIEDVSGRVAAVALQGPTSRDILKQMTDADLDGLKYFRLIHTHLRNLPVTLSRTGYTGDLGYEIWVDAAQAVPLWDALIEAGTSYGLTPAGILALDIVRVEAALLLIEVDYISAHRALIEPQKSSPLELNLGWAVNLDKENFVGRRALAEEKRRGPAWQFVGLEVDWEPFERLCTEAGLPPQLPATTSRASVPLYVDGEQRGYASSSCWSPLLKKYLALAHLQAPFAAPGTELMLEVTVEHQRKQTPARVVKTPFFDPERKRG